MDERFDLISYDRDTVEIHSSADLDDVLVHVEPDRVSWVTVHGCRDLDRADIVKLLSFFAIDPALIDRILSDGPREFSDQEPSCLFWKYMIPTTSFDPVLDTYVENRGSLLLGDGYLLLLQERGQSLSDTISDRLRAGRTRAQEYGVDYLLYLLIRAGIEQLEHLIDFELKNRFECLEDEVIASTGEDEILDRLLAERGHIKALYDPLRRIELFLMSVREGDVRFISERTQSLFTQNLKADFERLENGYERLMDWWAQLLDLHRANVGESTDKIMNMLTIVSTIFLPITFITGFFGMNFVNMPGLDNPNGFAITVLFMCASVLVTVIYMRRKDYF